MTAVRQNLIATISPTPYANPLLLDLIVPPPGRFFLGVPVAGVFLRGKGGAGPPYSYALLGGTLLPTGLSLNGTTGAITGTPTAQGVVSFVAQVEDSGSNTFQHAFSMNIESGLFGVVGHTAPTPGNIGTPYRFQFLVEDATGSTFGITYAVTAGSLPASLSLSSGGIISGTPSAAGVSYFTVRATKSGIYLDLPVSLQIFAGLSGGVAGITIPTALRSMTVGTPVAAYLQFADPGNATTITWAVTSGALPAGLSMDSHGYVKGTPTTVTTSSYTQPTITLTDSNGATATFAPSGANTFNVAPTIDATTIGNVVRIGADGVAEASLDFSALFFGSGNDGDMVLDGTNTYAGIFVKVGNSYTPSKHVSANSLTIVSPGYLAENAYAIDVADTFDLSGAPAGSLRSSDRLDASGQTGGIGITAVELGGSSSGVNGANGTVSTTPATPSSPANLSNGLPGNASTGGAGGAGTSASGGAGGGAGVSSPFAAEATKNPFDPMAYPGTGVLNGGNAGGAGGGGGGITIGSHAGGNGGGSGAGAGVGQIRARRFKTDGSTAAGAIDFAGGDAGKGTNGTATGTGGGGGGSGGEGGRFRLVYSERIGSPVTNLIDVSGGDGGTHGNSGGGIGVNGVDGKGADSGLIEVIDVGGGVLYFQDVVVAGGTTAGAVNKMTI